METVKDYFDVLDQKGQARSDLFRAPMGRELHAAVERIELLSLYFEYRMQADDRLHSLLKNIAASIDDLRNAIMQEQEGES